MSAEVSRKAVPGAPPQSPVSKSQQKRKKKVAKPKDDSPVIDIDAAPFIDHAPTVAAVKAGAVDEFLVASAAEHKEVTFADSHKKTSPAAEVVAKKIRALVKKTQRIATYSHLPVESLNEDQRRTAATLPALELTVKELEEVKKVIEALEADQTKEHGLARIQTEKETKQRIAQAVAEADAAKVQKISHLLSFIQLSSVIASEPAIVTADIDETERAAIFHASQILLGEASPQRDEVVTGFMSASGSIEGVPYARLVQIVEDHLVPPTPAEPPRTPTPTAPHVAPEEDAALAESEVLPAADADEQTIAASVSGASSFHFMQESELEGAAFEQGAEWVDKPEDEPVATHEDAPTAVEAAYQESAPLDWAAEGDDDLPAIASLQATFGSSGTATPNQAAAAAVPVPAWGSGDIPAALETNGQAHETAPVAAVDADGFTEARGRRGMHPRGGDRGFPDRARGRGGYRGGDGSRGGERGGFRGGRGGANGEGGGWRGGDGERGRGGYRGDRGRGEFRGGDFRSRGRGDRGGFRGRAGAAPVTEGVAAA